MTCQELMTADVKCCTPEETAASAAEIMRDHDVGPIPIVSDRYSRRLMGIVTDRDIAVKVVAEGRDPKSTPLSDVMSSRLITCSPNDDAEEAVDLMANSQIRRIPIVDEDGTLLGIISQADVALYSDDESTGELVGEISQPSGLGSQIRSSLSGGRGSGASALLLGAAGVALGAAAMYLMDPDRGNTRRTRLSDQARRAYRTTADYAGKAGRDLGNRASGVAAAARTRIGSSEQVPDQKLEARIRTALGRAPAHTRAVEIHTSDGRVTLEGPILESEHSAILSAVRSVAGVHDVEDRLQRHENPDGVPALQGELSAMAGRSNWNPGGWTPGMRLMAGATGGALTMLGMRAKGPAGTSAALLGGCLLASGLANPKAASWLRNRETR